ncbi:MAG: glycosyltransferase family 2 protein [Bacteroidales bacterium]|nr:glycosyltransferase family 2 protein [Bacteroidales bacterium]
MHKKPLISVITVCYNSAEMLQRTIKSLRMQTYKEIEYIVIDGASKDNTLQVIKENQDIINLWISEPDNGLYFAMNKGLEIASGDYLIYINAGDMFYAPDTLEKIFSNHQDDVDIYYGDTMILAQNQKEIGSRRLTPPKQLTKNSFRWGMTVCHQSILIKRIIAPKYDTSYRITADYDWVLSSIERAKKIVNTKIYISKFLSGGLSSKHVVKANKERYKIMCKHYGTPIALWYNFLMLFRLIITYIRKGRL